MSLSSNNADFLRMVGFTDAEIHKFATSTTPDGSMQPDINIRTPVWEKVIMERLAIVDRIQSQARKTTGKKFQRRRVNRVIDDWYTADPKLSPWDWLKRIYRRGKAVSSQTVREAAERTQRKVRTLLRRTK